MSWFDEEVAVEATKEYAQSFSVQTGEFLVSLGYVYMIESGSSNAKALKVEFTYESGKKGDATFWAWDKNTGTQKKEDGKPTFGSMQIAEFFGALEKSPNDFKPTKTTIKVYGEDKEMMVFRDLFEKPIRIVVQAKEEAHYQTGDVSEKPEVIGWFNAKTRMTGKEWNDKATEPKAIEGAIKRSAKLNKLKEPKATASTPAQKSVGDEANPWAN